MIPADTDHNAVVEIYVAQVACRFDKNNQPKVFLRLGARQFASLGSVATAREMLEGSRQ